MKKSKVNLIMEDGIFSLSRAWDKEKIWSPTGIEPMTSRTPIGRPNHWVTGRLVTSEVIFTVFVATRVLHTARISNFESTVCNNKERKMVNFKLGKKSGRWNLQFTQWLGRPTGYGRSWVRFPSGTRFFFVPRSWQTEYSIFLISFRT